MPNSIARSDTKLLRVSGILALVGIGGAHFEYWYRSLRQIPVHDSIIGPLFIFTFAFAWVLALVMMAFPRVLLAVLAAGFAFATLGGYFLSLYLPAGIFEYKDPGISYSGGIAIACEVLGGLALLGWAGLRLAAGGEARARSVTGAPAATGPAFPAPAGPATGSAPARVPAAWSAGATPAGATPAVLGGEGAAPAVPEGEELAPAPLVPPGKVDAQSWGRAPARAQVEPADANAPPGPPTPRSKRR